MAKIVREPQGCARLSPADRTSEHFSKGKNLPWSRGLIHKTQKLTAPLLACCRGSAPPPTRDNLHLLGSRWDRQNSRGAGNEPGQHHRKAREDPPESSVIYRKHSHLSPFILALRQTRSRCRERGPLVACRIPVEASGASSPSAHGAGAPWRPHVCHPRSRHGDRAGLSLWPQNIRPDGLSVLGHT